MDAGREERLRQAALGGSGAKAKAANRKPELVLEDDWYAKLKAEYGAEFAPVPWKRNIEKRLAKALVKEVGLETALAMTARFIADWRRDREGVPPFRFLWTARESYRAVALGQAPTRLQQVSQNEYSEERDGKHPKFGW